MQNLPQTSDEESELEEIAAALWDDAEKGSRFGQGDWKSLRVQVWLCGSWRILRSFGWNIGK